MSRAIYLCATVIAVALAACDNTQPSNAAQIAAVPAPAAAPVEPAYVPPQPPRPRQWTKTEFANLVVGEPMAVVRERVGQPSNVLDRSSDGYTDWAYWDHHVTIIDENAGIPIKGSAIIAFSDATGLATGVRY